MIIRLVNTCLPLNAASARETMRGKIKLLPRERDGASRNRDGDSRIFWISPSWLFPFTESAKKRKKGERLNSKRTQYTNGRKASARPGLQPPLSFSLAPLSFSHSLIVVAGRQSKINGAEVNTFGVKSWPEAGESGKVEPPGKPKPPKKNHEQQRNKRNNGRIDTEESGPGKAESLKKSFGHLNCQIP